MSRIQGINKTELEAASSMSNHRTSGVRHSSRKSPVADRVERELRDVQGAQAGIREPRREERVVAGMEPLEDLPRGGLVVEGDVVRHAHDQKALPRQELQQVAASNQPHDEPSAPVRVQPNRMNTLRPCVVWPTAERMESWSGMEPPTS